MLAMMLSGATQVVQSNCFVWPRAAQVETPTVEIIIEIVAISVDGPLEAHRSGCPAPAYILIYGNNDNPSGRNEQPSALVEYKLKHPTERILARVSGKANVLTYPPSFHRRPAATFFVNRVLAIWSKPSRD
jgi:hypothetical protein